MLYDANLNQVHEITKANKWDYEHYSLPESIWESQCGKGRVSPWHVEIGF
jgi:hypothetical protein